MPLLSDVGFRWFRSSHRLRLQVAYMHGTPLVREACMRPTWMRCGFIRSSSASTKRLRFTRPEVITRRSVFSMPSESTRAVKREREGQRSRARQEHMLHTFTYMCFRVAPNGGRKRMVNVNVDINAPSPALGTSKRLPAFGATLMCLSEGDRATWLPGGRCHI